MGNSGLEKQGNILENITTVAEVVDMRVALVLKVFLNYLLMKNSCSYCKNVRTMDFLMHLITPTMMNLSKLVKEISLIYLNKFWIILDRAGNPGTFSESLSENRKHLTLKGDFLTNAF